MSYNPLSTLVRKLLMSSYLYYRFDISPLSDADYDDICEFVANRWDKLSDYEQWLLDNPDNVKASGFRVKVPYAAQGGAMAWAKKLGYTGVYLQDEQDMYYSEKYGLHWCYAGG